MSRHQMVRKIDARQENDDYDYAFSPSSYDDPQAFSPSVEGYLYRRDSLSYDRPPEREEEEEEDYSYQPGTLEEYIKFYKLTTKQEDQLRRGIGQVFEVIGGDQFLDVDIADALYHFNFDIEKTINSFLEDSKPNKSSSIQNQPQPKNPPSNQNQKNQKNQKNQNQNEKSKANQTQTQNQQKSKTQPSQNQNKTQTQQPQKQTAQAQNKNQNQSMNEKSPSKEVKTVFGFDSPSPDDIVKGARVNKDTPSTLSKSNSQKSSHESLPRSQLSSGLLNLSLSKNNSTDSLTLKEETPKDKTSKLIKANKAKINILEEVQKRKTGKDHINLIVAGHVDAGKSTMMGHLLYLLNEVDKKTMAKFERESQKMGKSSFAFAWALDETEEERSRGVTMDISIRKFETNSKQVTILDAPGHRDFVPNMISGACQADVCILVVDGTRGEFEAGFESDGQTKEHALLLRSLAITTMIVAINKLDNVKWSEERFTEIINKILPFLKQSGFKEQNIFFVPCSGLKGENIIERTAPELSWYKGPTLVGAIDALPSLERSYEKPLRISVNDIFRGATVTSSSNVFISGRVETGYVSQNDQILVLPSNSIATVKSIEIHGMGSKLAIAGESVTLGLTGLDRDQYGLNSILCDAAFPVPISNSFVAQILTFETQTPIMKGESVIFHYASLNEQAVITKLTAVLDRGTGEVKQKNPRFLVKNSTATIEIKVSKPVCIETFKSCKELSRFLLRSHGKTIAAGVIQEIKEISK